MNKRNLYYIALLISFASGYSSAKLRFPIALSFYIIGVILVQTIYWFKTVNKLPEGYTILRRTPLFDEDFKYEYDLYYQGVILESAFKSRAEAKIAAFKRERNLHLNFKN